MGATVLWYRLLLAGIAVVWLIVLFLFQYRLTDALGRRENEALAAEGADVLSHCADSGHRVDRSHGIATATSPSGA